MAHLMKRAIFLILILFPVGLFTSGCSVWDLLGIPAGGSSGSNGVTHEERDVSGKITVALGGIGENANVLAIDEEVTLLDLTNEDPDLFSLEERDGFETFADGHGARVVPQRVGIGYVTPITSGKTVAPVQVTIPPQKLIQILIGEARGELDREATLEEERVKLSSVSVTGDAVGAVIRNRIDLINETGTPGLFVADALAYSADPPLSYYEAVIEANASDVYQFSPANPEDPGNDVYLQAANRPDLEESLHNAYDQAVLTAADIFNGDTEDPTGGAFAFYSPTDEEFANLQDALETQTLVFPAGAGTTDANFPAMSPIQVLILDGIAPSASNRNVPSFVFVRSRGNIDPAVTDQP